MVNTNRITQDAPELREVLLGFLDSASSLCDMMNATMAAVLNEIMSIQADFTSPTETVLGSALGARVSSTSPRASARRVEGIPREMVPRGLTDGQV